MPSIVKNVKIVASFPSSVIQRGDSILICPTSMQKTYAGAGFALTGDVSATLNVINETVVDDQDEFEVGPSKIGTIA
jgi:spore germination protein PA/spore germination protein PF